MQTDLPTTADDLADLRRRLTATIVKHGRTDDGVVPALQRACFTGPEIRYGIDAARNAARLILREPAPPIASNSMAAILARALTAFPDLAREVA